MLPMLLHVWAGSSARRHMFNKKQVRDLAKQPGFDKDALRELLEEGPPPVETCSGVIGVWVPGRPLRAGPYLPGRWADPWFKRRGLRLRRQRWRRWNGSWTM